MHVGKIEFFWMEWNGKTTVANYISNKMENKIIAYGRIVDVCNMGKWIGT